MSKLPVQWVLLFVFFSTVVYLILGLPPLDMDLSWIQVVGLLMVAVGLATFRHWLGQPSKNVLDNWDTVGFLCYFVGLVLYECQRDSAGSLVMLPTPVEVAWWTVAGICVVLVWFHYIAVPKPGACS